MVQHPYTHTMIKEIKRKYSLTFAICAALLDKLVLGLGMDMRYSSEYNNNSIS